MGSLEARRTARHLNKLLHMEGECSMLVKQENTYKSVFILARTFTRACQGYLFEVKIGQGSGDIMGAREGIPVPIDAQDRPPLLHPVTKFFDDEKKHTVFSYTGSLVAVTFNGPSKLYMLVTASVEPKPEGRVFDTETKSFYKLFKRPKSFERGANLIPAYGKLYHLGKWGPREGPAFERYDPCNDCWEPLPPAPAELFRGIWTVTGYAIYGDNILVSFRPNRDNVFAFHVIENKWHPVSGSISIQGRAVVVGDTIYALSTAFQMVKFSFDSSMYSITTKQELGGLENVGQYTMGERFDNYSEYMVHLGNLEFCRVCTAVDNSGDGRQPIWITTFQIVDTPHIKILHSAVFDVDMTDYYIYYSLTPDYEDDEPKGEETKGPQEKRCKRKKRSKRKRDCIE